MITTIPRYGAGWTTRIYIARRHHNDSRQTIQPAWRA